MEWQYTFFVVFAPAAALVCLGVALYSWRHRLAPGASGLALAMLAVAGWVILNQIELADPTEAGTVFWAKLEYLFFTFAPVAWLACVLQYTGRERWLAWPYVALLCVLPTITTTLAWTNESHHLIWTTYEFTPVGTMLAFHPGHGWWYYAHMLFGYVLVLASAGLLLREYARASGLYRRQSIWLVLGSVIPLALNLIYSFNLIPGFTKDYSPLAFAFGGLAFCVGVFRYHLFDLLPVARNALFANAQDGMLVLDAERRLIDVNPAAQALLGIPPAGSTRAQQGPIGTSALGRLPAPALLQCLAGESPVAVALEGPGPAGYYELQTTPLCDVRGRRAGSLVVMRDVSVRRQAEQLRSEFYSMITHDLRSPAGSICSSLEMVLDDHFGPVLPQQREFLGLALDAARKLLGLINDYLDYATIDAGYLQLVVAPVDLRELTEQAVRLSMAQAHARRQTLTLELPPAPLVVPADGDRLKQVLDNLLSNALKYTPEGGCITVALSADSQGVVLRVADTGSGIPAEELPMVFSKYHRVTGKMTRMIRGTGLGLFIVKTIVDAHGGTIVAESTGVPGEGTTFTLRLPLP